MSERKEFVLRVQQPDGSWIFDMENYMPLREAKKLAMFNRVMGGVLCQVWPAPEAEAIIEGRHP